MSNLLFGCAAVYMSPTMTAENKHCWRLPCTLPKQRNGSNTLFRLSGRDLSTKTQRPYPPLNMPLASLRQQLLILLREQQRQHGGSRDDSFTRGFCKNGSNCKFVHSDDFEGSMSALSSSPSNFDAAE
ncbi:hypothetical protein CRG98_003536 [Punica granatum]|uniref:C3H1-type domain-containing protein n=1 Tax=Punica granatum TaxID=22663 RepID=A0A2I0L5T6_PUNGR|nr:hypothetical protein CRG98_003536 [Punica granatum]